MRPYRSSRTARARAGPGRARRGRTTVRWPGAPAGRCGPGRSRGRGCRAGRPSALAALALAGTVVADTTRAPARRLARRICSVKPAMPGQVALDPRLADERAAAPSGLPLQGPLALEGGERLAEGHAADPEGRGEDVLAGQPVAGHEVAPADEIGQPPGDRRVHRDAVRRGERGRAGQPVERGLRARHRGDATAPPGAPRGLVFCLDPGRAPRATAPARPDDQGAPRGVMDGSQTEGPAPAGPVLPPSLCDAVDVLRDRPLVVTELAGGLTNRNYKVVAPDGAYVVRISGPGTGALAIDRDDEYRNSVIAAGTGVGAPVYAYVPDESALVIGFIEGRTLGDDDFGRPGVLDRVAAVVPTAPRRTPGSSTTSTCSRSRPATCAVVLERGYRLPEGYLEHAPDRGPHPGGAGRAHRAHGGLQQRPAGRQLHRRRRRRAYHRLRVLRQQRRLLRARQHLERVPPRASTSSSTSSPPTTDGISPTRWPGRGCRA